MVLNTKQKYEIVIYCENGKTIDQISDKMNIKGKQLCYGLIVMKQRELWTENSEKDQK